MKSYNLTEHFTLWELIKSEFASRNGLDNNPKDIYYKSNGREFMIKENNIIENLKNLAVNLEIIRTHFGNKIVRIKSGFRTIELSIAIGSLASSQHVTGETCDFEIKGVSNQLAFEKIISNRFINFDKIMLEYYNHKEEEGLSNNSYGSGWIHISFKRHIHTGSVKNKNKIMFNESNLKYTPNSENIVYNKIIKFINDNINILKKRKNGQKSSHYIIGDIMSEDEFIEHKNDVTTGRKLDRVVCQAISKGRFSCNYKNFRLFSRYNG